VKIFPKSQSCFNKIARPYFVNTLQ